MLTSSYYRNADAILMVYDITDHNSFAEVENLYLEGARYASRALNILVGNKTDLEDARNVSADEVSAVAKRLGISFCIETSAKSGDRTEELFDKLSKKLLERCAAGPLRPRACAAVLSSCSRCFLHSLHSCSCCSPRETALIFDIHAELHSVFTRTCFEIHADWSQGHERQEELVGDGRRQHPDLVAAEGRGLEEGEVGVEPLLAAPV